jgi:hypothetical protein
VKALLVSHDHGIPAAPVDAVLGWDAAVGVDNGGQPMLSID